jgi:hypothetical protein
MPMKATLTMPLKTAALRASGVVFVGTLSSWSARCRLITRRARWAAVFGQTRAKAQRRDQYAGRVSGSRPPVSRVSSRQR